MKKIWKKGKDIGMKFWIGKYVKKNMKKRKRETMEEIELPNQESLRTLEKKLQLPVNIGSGHHQTNRCERKGTKGII